MCTTVGMGMVNVLTFAITIDGHILTLLVQRVEIVTVDFLQSLCIDRFGFQNWHISALIIVLCNCTQIHRQECSSGKSHHIGQTNPSPHSSPPPLLPLKVTYQRVCQDVTTFSWRIYLVMYSVYNYTCTIPTDEKISDIIIYHTLPQGFHIFMLFSRNRGSNTRVLQTSVRMCVQVCVGVCFIHGELLSFGRMCRRSEVFLIGLICLVRFILLYLICILIFIEGVFCNKSML